MADSATKKDVSVTGSATPTVKVKDYQSRNLVSKIWYGLHKLVDGSNLILDRGYDLIEVSSDYAVAEIKNLKDEAS